MQAAFVFLQWQALLVVKMMMGGGDELKASVNKATAASVSVEEKSYEKVVTEGDKTTINTALDSAGIDKIIAGATDYSDFVQNSDDTSEYSMRAMSIKELGTTIYKELEEKITKYHEDLEKNEKGSFSYTIAPGEITGLQDGIKMTIPLFYLSSAAARSSESSAAISYTQGICSTYLEDFSKTKASDIFKQSAVNSAQNFNYNIATIFDAEKAESGDYTSASDFMKITGNAKLNLETTSYTSFVIEDIAGKISAELNLAVSVTDFSNIIDKLSSGGSISPETLINSDTSKSSLKIDVCDLNGNVIYNYKTLTDISEIESYISLFDLSSIINSTDESEE